MFYTRVQSTRLIRLTASNASDADAAAKTPVQVAYIWAFFYVNCANRIAYVPPVAVKCVIVRNWFL